MPPEQPPASNARPARTSSAEKGKHSPITGGVRGLLGLPMRESGVLAIAPLTAPLLEYHYRQAPLPESEENDERFRGLAADEELIETGSRTDPDPQSHFPASLPRDDASFSGATPRKPVDARSAPSAMSVEHRGRTSFVIPGVSTHRTEFGVLSHTDATKATPPEESRESDSDKMSPLHARLSRPHAPEMAIFDNEFLSRLEHLVIGGAKGRNDSLIQPRSVMPLSPRLLEQMGVPNGEQGDTDVARRVAQLQRVVSELAATFSSQAAQMRDKSQIQGHGRTTPAERMVVVQRINASSTTPRAFWERSRLGRFYLKTGR